MNNKNKKNNGKKGKVSVGNLLLIFLLAFAFSYFVSSMFFSSSGYDTDAENVIEEEAAYNEFIEKVDADLIDKVTIKGNYITAITKPENNTAYVYTVVRTTDYTLTDRLLEHGVTFEQEVDSSSSIFTIVLTLLPMALIVFIFYRMYAGNGGVFGAGRSNAKLVSVEESTGVTFADVAGEDEAKESLMEIVDFLHNPEKYVQIGAKLPKGALLVGPPGTGKTLLAKAVAGEAKVPFYSLTGSDFVEMFVGVGASRVRDLFKKANESAPCIIFIDEIDAIGKKRDSRVSTNDEREQTLNQLLSEMDGFDPGKGIIVLGSTNRPEILDPALLRPGRFDRRIIVEKPDLNGRIDILKVHAKDVKLDETVDFKEIALATAGVSGADLANIINEGAIDAAKRGAKAVSQKDLWDAVETVLVGKEKKDRVLSPKEKEIVAYHEVGHAIVTAASKHTEPVQKITIIPRTMGALGYVMQVPEEEKYLNTKDELEEQIISLLAGRAAEEIFFDTVTTGASNDIEQATNIAKAMITQYGMSEKFGLAGFASSESPYLTGETVMNCGDITESEIDKEVVDMLHGFYEKAKQTVEENREKMVEIASYLIEKETITGKEFMEIFNREEGNDHTGPV